MPSFFVAIETLDAALKIAMVTLEDSPVLAIS
jgi:hypothetical protein